METNLIMKRGVIFVFVGILILAFVLAQTGFVQHGKVISKEGLSKISSEVIESIEEQEEVRVYIQLKSETKKGKSIASKNVKENVSNSLKKVKHKFDDKISAFVSEEELIELQKNPNVEAVELVGTRNILLQDSVPLINSSNEIWNLQLNNTNLTGKGETICIIDTGVNYSHSDLGGCYGDNDPSSNCKVLGGWDYCADDTTCGTEDSDPMDAHWHGTHVSGIVAANGNINGVAPEAKLIVIKAANSAGTFWDDDLEKAIDWCVNNASTFNISVISMSLGGGLYSSYCPSDALSDEINNAVANNISVVVASGNDGSTSQINGPACVENATPIGGTSKTDTMYSGGNRNNIVLLLAPGVSINSTDSDGDYRISSGTSMSTPHVAGAFAIINQYRRLEGSVGLTPLEIEDVLNDSGKVIYDSGGSGLNFSRIQIYQTLLEIDQGGVETTLNFPPHNTINSDTITIFNCGSTDIQLSNLTFYLWNSTNDLINQTTYDASSNNFEIEINKTLDDGTYTWNCLGYDNQSNFAWAPSNYTLKRGTQGVILNSPADDNITTSSSFIFNCSATSTIANLTNITLQVWNSTSDALVHSNTTDITGISNVTTFSYTLPAEDDYEWNCLAYDANTNAIRGDTNYTILYDATDPVVSLVSPADEAEEDEGSINFKFNVTDRSDIASCRIYIDGDLEKTDTSIIKGVTQTISYSLVEGLYDWKIRCYDEAGNSDETSERELRITSSTDSPSSSSSTSPTNTTTLGTTYITTETQLETGYSKEISIADKINFIRNNESHRLEVEGLTSSSIKVKIYSDIFTFIIPIRETKKIDLDNNKIYDISITYNEYKNLKANITIKSIEEPIGTRQISTDIDSNESSNETISSGEIMSSLKGLIEKVKDFFTSIPIKTWIILGSIGGIIFFAGIGYFLHKIHGKKLDPLFEKKYETLFKKKRRKSSKKGG